jgi:hypothetical protein
LANAQKEWQKLASKNGIAFPDGVVDGLDLGGFWHPKTDS